VAPSTQFGARERNSILFLSNRLGAFRHNVPPAIDATAVTSAIPAPAKFPSDNPLLEHIRGHEKSSCFERAFLLRREIENRLLLELRPFRGRYRTAERVS
jgi:hypothetical protein